MKHTLTFDGQDITFDVQDGSAEAVTRIATGLLKKEGFVNLDFCDVKAILDGAKNVTVSEGTASGTDRCKLAAQEAAKGIKGAKRLMIAVKTSPDITLAEMADAAEVIAAASDPDAVLIWGHTIDEALGDKVQVSVAAAV